MTRLICIALVALALAGCTATGGARDCETADVQIHENLVTGKVIFTGPVRTNQCISGGDGQRLRSEIDRAGGTVQHFVDARMEWTGNPRSYWLTARLEGTDTDLELGPAQARIGTCSRFMWMGCDQIEEVTAILPEAALLQAARDGQGLAIRFVRKRGSDYVARFSAEQVLAHQDRIALWQAEAAKP